MQVRLPVLNGMKYSGLVTLPSLINLSGRNSLAASQYSSLQLSIKLLMKIIVPFSTEYPETAETQLRHTFCSITFDKTSLERIIEELLKLKGIGSDLENRD
jgi:hypothetical protein